MQSLQDLILGLSGAEAEELLAASPDEFYARVQQIAEHHDQT